MNVALRSQSAADLSKTRSLAEGGRSGRTESVFWPHPLMKPIARIQPMRILRGVATPMKTLPGIKSPFQTIHDLENQGEREKERPAYSKGAGPMQAGGCA